jgi:transcriptional regulator with XRE-family HTH domain
MWLENLKDARIRAGNPTFKEIAQKALCSERTVSRIFNGKTKFPDTPTLKGICEALNTTLDAILEGTNTSVGDIDALKEQIKTLTEEVDRLSKLVELLEKDLAHKNEVILLKDEIIETHRFYRKSASELTFT